VQLDQFPSAVIESIQVSKTFMPDQQGDSGAGTINIVTRSVPEERILDFKIGTTYKPGITGNSDFRWNPRGMDYWGQSDRSLEIRSMYLNNTPGDPVAAQLGPTLDPRLGTTTEAPPPDSSWGVTVGDVFKLSDDWCIGGLGAFSYSCKYEGYDNGINNNWALNTSQANNGPVTLNDPPSVSMGVEKILWGGLATMGVRKGDEQDVGLTFLGNHAADSYAQENVFTPNGIGTGYGTDYQETLDYLERDFYSVQEHGRNTLDFFENWNAIPDVLSLQAPVFDWTFAQSDSHFYEPDRSTITANYYSDPGGPKLVRVHEFRNGRWGWYDEWVNYPPISTWIMPTSPVMERDWYTIDEQSRQMFFNLKQPFENWTGDKGYLKTGYFHDTVKRQYNVDSLTYANPSGETSGFDNPVWDLPDAGGGNLEQFLPYSRSPIDYKGSQEIDGRYAMGDLPALSWLHLLGGARVERTFMETKLSSDTASTNPDDHAVPTFYLDSSGGMPAFRQQSDPTLMKHDWDAGATLDQVKILPAYGLVVKPEDDIALRLNWSKTIARPTFKELVPVLSPIQGTSDNFIGNSDLKISTMDNYDARLEVFPGAGNVLATSIFLKRIQDPIDRILVQDSNGQAAIMPYNYPSATIKGAEAEVRQAMGPLWRLLDGVTLGANGTLLRSKLQYSQTFEDMFSQSSGDRSRPMIGQPDYLANLNGTYDFEACGVELNVYYTFQGTTMVTGEAMEQTYPVWQGGTAGSGDDYWIPNVYQKPMGTLNASVSKKFWTNWKLTIGAKNILQPDVTQYYDFAGSKEFRTRYKTPIEYTFGLEGKW